VTKERAAFVLALGFAVAVAVAVILGLLDVHWLVTGPVTGLLVGLTVRYVLSQPRVSEQSE
jgi:hypothetical protein